MHDPIVVAMELPKPNVVIFEIEGGPTVVLVDPRVPRAVADDTLAQLEHIIAGTPHAVR